MKTLTASDACKRLERLIEEITESGQPVLIAGSRSAAVLLAVADWHSIQETVRLLSVPGMRESIHKGMGEPAEDCSDEPGWPSSVTETAPPRPADPPS